MQTQIKKRDSFDPGIRTLMELRGELWDTVLSLKKEKKINESRSG